METQEFAFLLEFAILVLRAVTVASEQQHESSGARRTARPMAARVTESGLWMTDLTQHSVLFAPFKEKVRKIFKQQQ